MAEKEDDKKKQGGDDANPDAKVKETILEQSEGGEDVQADDAIRYFIRDRLIDFYNEMEQATDAIEAHLESQPDEYKAAFSQQGFFGFLGNSFEKELFNIVGGAGRPLMDAMVGEVHNAVSNAEHSSGNSLPIFINHAMRRSVRDACWYLRDSATGILSAQWGELLKLAADGGNQFIPAVYHLGLPTYSFKPQEFAQTMIEQCDGYRRAMGLQAKEVEEKQPEAQKDGAQAEKIEEDAQKDMIEREDKRQAATVGA